MQVSIDDVLQAKTKFKNTDFDENNLRPFIFSVPAGPGIIYETPDKITLRVIKSEDVFEFEGVLLMTSLR